MIVLDKVVVVKKETDIQPIVDKIDLLNQMSQAVSYYHVLQLFNNSKHITLSKNERVNLLNVANSRLRELQKLGRLNLSETDPYWKKWR